MSGPLDHTTTPARDHVIPATMRAIVQDRYGSAEVLKLASIPTPIAGEGEVLIRVQAAGVDRGVWHLMVGEPYLIRIAGFGLRAPKTRVPGLDVAGYVAAIGKGVTGFRPGDAVFGTGKGAYAEYACAPATKLALKPPGLDFAPAAALSISGCTALQGLRAGGELRPGQKVLILGAAGGVGSYAVQLAKFFGAHVTGVCSAAKHALVRSLGADAVIDYTREDFTAGSVRYDLIFDLAGNRPLSRLRRVLTPKGTLVLAGGENGGKWLGGLERNLQMLAVAPFTGQKLRGLLATERREDFIYLAELVAAGKITPVIERTFPLAETADAIRHLESGRAQGKIVVTV